MKRGYSVLLVAVFSLTGALACKPKTGLNVPCNLPVRFPDGGVGFLSEGKAQESTQANKDFIAFGAVTCEDLVCVRDSSFPKPDGGDLTMNAEGYCSRPCLENTECPSDDEKLDKGSTAMRCRAILLDKETLAVLSQDPQAKQYLNGVSQPFFCARGGATDAGK